MPEQPVTLIQQRDRRNALDQNLEVGDAWFDTNDGVFYACFEKVGPHARMVTLTPPAGGLLRTVEHDPEEFFIPPPPVVFP